MSAEWVQTIVIVPLLTFLVGVIINFITKYMSILAEKNTNEKARRYIILAENLVISSVGMVYQTYVEALKTAGTFGPAEQKIAFERAKTEVLKQLTVDGKQAITYLYNDVNEWLQTQIEFQISVGKPDVPIRATMLQTFSLC